MKRVLGWTIFLLAFLSASPFGTAVAADLPVKMSSPVAVPPETGPLWEGIYVGANVGEDWGRSSWCTDENVVNCGAAAPTGIAHASPAGIVGGAQFGDRWQWGNVVVGLEGMLDGLNISTTQADPAITRQTLTTKFSGLTSATGQVGLAFDRLLAYGKGGWALTDLKLEANDPGVSTLDASEFASGWTIGGGLEYQVVPHLIVGIEYDYYRFAPKNITGLTDSAGVTVPCSFCNFGSSTTMQTLLARISLQAGPMPAIR